MLVRPAMVVGAPATVIVLDTPDELLSGILESCVLDKDSVVVVIPVPVDCKLTV